MPHKELLNSIGSPADLRMTPEERLPQLALEIRDLILDVVSKNGGHLASSLGVVELTIALHYVFDTPRDMIVWDVGHQTYAHKILTGRRETFNTLRTYKGLSGFPKSKESEYDVFDVGHSGTSISASVGIMEALKLAGNDRKVIAVIGDGSMTAGLAFEGLNQAGHLDRNIIIVLNDNEFSISPNVGALSSFLSRKWTGRTFTSFRGKLKTLLKSIPSVGEEVFHAAKKIEDTFKGLVTPGILFEALNFEYVGPLDGHRIDTLVDTFRNVKMLENPVLVHVVTKKGKGYLPAEKNPSKYHGIGPFDRETGEPVNSVGPPSYTEVFADTVIKLAEKDDRIVGITAAMPGGTGLEKFAKRFPERCYDVGIAEQHGVTFAAGMAKKGFRPVAAIYSTFLQRSYDQIVHDVCLQNLPVFFAIDRGGIVGEDGPTHHGAFDLSYLRHIPNMVVMAPKDENELRRMIRTGIEHDGPAAVRYPRGRGAGVPLDQKIRCIPIGKGEILQEGEDLCIIAVGATVAPALEAAKALAKEGLGIRVVNARFIKPMDADLILQSARRCGRIVTIEENAVIGGLGSGVLEILAQHDYTNVRVRCLGLPDQFIEHGSQNLLRNKLKMDAQGITKTCRELLENEKEPGRPAIKSASSDKPVGM